MKKTEGGLRLKGKSKKKPLITIVTVVRNGEKTLERTIKSVINQTARKEIEYIIIDGNSTDKTIDIIKKYENKIDYWMSEPDKGIYDAMNKGVLLARGEYLYFLGSDDYLIDNKVLRDVITCINKEKIDILYGNVKTLINNKERFFPGKERTKRELRAGKKIYTQGVFFSKIIFINEGTFNQEYKIAADWDLICKVYIKSYRFKYLNRVISFYSPYGVSSIKGSINETAEIIGNNFGNYYALLYKLKRKVPIFISNLLFKIGLLNLIRKILGGAKNEER